MRSWSVHWANREVIVDFEEEQLFFSCLSCDCKVFHEFIGECASPGTVCSVP